MSLLLLNVGYFCEGKCLRFLRLRGILRQLFLWRGKACLSCRLFFARENVFDFFVCVEFFANFFSGGEKHGKSRISSISSFERNSSISWPPYLRPFGQLGNILLKMEEFASQVRLVGNCFFLFSLFFIFSIFFLFVFYWGCYTIFTSSTLAFFFFFKKKAKFNLFGDF